MKVNLDFGRTEAMMKEVSNQVLVKDYIEHAFKSVYPAGLKGSLQRQVGRIQRKLDLAVETNAEEIDFEDGELDLIREAVEKTDYPVNLSKYVVVFVDELKK